MIQLLFLGLWVWRNKLIRINSVFYKLLTVRYLTALFICIAQLSSLVVYSEDHQQYWARHTIDNSSSGADGVRLSDVNNDGRMDIVTGWEEGGVVRLYINPGPNNSKKRWPFVTVGEVASPEDAVLVDLDNDGYKDVVSCSEGKTNQITVHWAPTNSSEYMDSTKWKSEFFPSSKDYTQWMFCLPIEIDNQNGIDLIVGSKNNNAQIGWMQSPKNPRDLSTWKWYPIKETGWIMSIFAFDINHDSKNEILFSDRKGDDPGCFWMTWSSSPNNLPISWHIHKIHSKNAEYMFMDANDLDSDGTIDICSAVKGDDFYWFQPKNTSLKSWERKTIPFAPNSGSGKAIRIVDLNNDKKNDLVYSCEHANGSKEGVFWIETTTDFKNPEWKHHPISGPDGIKYDLLELLDLDDDGDIDIITCEERDQLGVIWYENPVTP
jgi:hypothetical protein